MKKEDFIIKNKKVLYVKGDILLASHGYEMYKSYDQGLTWEYWASVKEWKYKYISKVRLLSRFLRVEITECFLIEDEYYVVAKKGIYKYKKDKNSFEKIEKIRKGSRPLNVAVDNEGSVYYGEYHSNKKRESVSVYKKTIDTDSFKEIYKFPEKTIRHVHGLYYDIYENKIWFVTGDSDAESIIGYTSDDFKIINKVCLGSQQCRVVKMFFYKEKIIFVTDAIKEDNNIYTMDRHSEKIINRYTIEGPVIYGTQCDVFSAFSTEVEPDLKNKNNISCLYVSKDGVIWEKINECQKDKWPMLFQYGTYVFPKYGEVSEYLYCYGQSLKNIDGHTVRIQI